MQETVLPEVESGGILNHDASAHALYLDARMAKAWLLTGGLTETLGEGADSKLFDLGLRYTW